MRKAALFCFCLVLVACGGDPGLGDRPGVGTTLISLEEVCETYARLLCESLEACGEDVTGCEEGWASICCSGAHCATQVPVPDGWAECLEAAIGRGSCENPTIDYAACAR